ncbi:MAG: DUF885 domain-containing protein [Chthoniobacterales bacterium]|nr:DUF885 domain-containing protein [Chthoniobacterales bacterium]
MTIFRPPPHSRAAALHREAEDFFRRSWDAFPQEAAELGLRGYRGRLGDNTAKAHRAHAALLRRALGQVEALPAVDFDGDDWLDRRGFLALLRTRLFFHDTFPHWQLDPQIHCQTPVNSIFHLVTRGSDNLAAVTPAILSLLADTPRFLGEGEGCLRRPVPLWTRLAAESCEGAAGFLEELAPQIVPLAERPARARRLFSLAAGAFRGFAAHLGRIRTGAPRGYAVGREAFEFLTRERLGLDLSADEVFCAGQRLVAQTAAALEREAAKFGRRSAAAILEQARAEWRPSAPTLLGEYRRVTADIKKRLARSGIVSLPRGEKLKVLPVPDFLRQQFPTAAYSAPGPFDSDQTGIFWVNDLSLTARTEAARRAEIAQHFGLELTCAHEAYPGHHLQFIVQNRHPSRLRRMFSHAVYYEGWTLWCEKMCVDRGLYKEPHARLIQLHDALWRAHRILIDAGLHTRGLTHAGATRHLVREVGFTRARAAADVNWYTAAPTVPMSYLLGRCQVESLRERHSGESLRRFNDRILAFGSLPWNWLRLA